MFAFKAVAFLNRSHTILHKAKWRNVGRISYCTNAYKLKSFQDDLDIVKDNKSMIFPYVWLRDNCQCENCFHFNSKSRIIDWKNFDIDIKPKSINLLGETLNIEWEDNHKSVYKFDWLKERSFNKESRDEYTNKVYKLQKIHWSKSDFNNVFKKFDYEGIINDNIVLKEWLENLCIFGVALITNVAQKEDSCRNVANRVDYIRKTHYGEEFIVKSKPNTTNVAYLSSNLQLHTDLPYYEYKPGANLLHCLVQTKGKGGESLLCDGLHVAKILKEKHRDKYDVLTKILVDWEDIGTEEGNKFHTIYRSPIIKEDENGDIIRINYSTPQRGNHMNASVEEVKNWYKSLRLFVDLIHEESTVMKMSEDEILCFDNRRLLHGRTEYQDTVDNTRHIIGAYLDWDNIYSRLRVLSHRK